MDLSDLSKLPGTLPKNGNLAIAASLFVLMESGRTMSSMVGDDRFSSKYGGEIMGGTYVASVGILTSIVVQSALPAVTAALSIAFYTALYLWQEERAREY